MAGSKSDDSNPDVAEFDIESLTVREVRLLEGVLGKKFGKVIASFRDESFGADEFQALAWVAERRINPNVKFEDLEERSIKALMNGGRPDATSKG